ncbi:hypothetical protein K7432_008125 [Basidiobolus ranarum]
MNITSSDFVNIRSMDNINNNGFVFDNVDYKNNLNSHIDEEYSAFGRKRSYDDYGVDNFFNDVKKQRLPAEYNTGMANMLDNIGRFILDDNSQLLNQQNEQDKEQLLEFFETLKDQIDLDTTNPSGLNYQTNFEPEYSLDFSSNNIPSGDFNINVSHIPSGQPDTEYAAPFGGDNLYTSCSLYPPSEVLETNLNPCNEFDIMQLPEDIDISSSIFPHLPISPQPEFAFGIENTDTVGSINDSSDILYPYFDHASGQIVNSTVEQNPRVINHAVAHPMRSVPLNGNNTSVDIQHELTTPRLDFDLPQYTAISMFSQMSAPENQNALETGSSDGSNKERLSRTGIPTHRARSVSPAKSDYMKSIQTEKDSYIRKKLSHNLTSDQTRAFSGKESQGHASRLKSSGTIGQKRLDHAKLVEIIIQKLRTPNVQLPRSQKPVSIKQLTDDENSSELMEKLQARLEAIRIGGKAT